MQAVKRFAAGRWSRASFSTHDEADPAALERVELPQMEHAAEILRDEHGVPHIYAESEHDLFFLHGFCQAEDRLWQMEGLRRVAAGRVSEMMGPAALTVDTFARTLGWSRRAAEEWQLLLASADPNAVKAVAMLTAYCDGVNAFIQQATAQGGKGNMLNGGPLPMFFMLLGIDPEPWRPEDTLGILRVLCYQMNHGGQHPAVRQLLANIIGEDDALRWSRTDCDPTTGDEWPPTRPNPPPPPSPPSTPPPASSDSGGADDGGGGSGGGGAPTANPTSAGAAAAAAEIPEGLLLRTLAGQPSELELPTQGQGSNWWALGADRTSTGGPLLANDPHLSVRVPSIWYTTTRKPLFDAISLLGITNHLPRQARDRSKAKLADSLRRYESHLYAKESGLHTAGVQMPGFPVTIIGHNEHVCAGVVRNRYFLSGFI